MELASEALVGLRRKKQWSQRRLAEEIGSSFGDVSRWENGGDMYLSTLFKLLIALDATPGDLARLMGFAPTIVEVKDILLELRESIARHDSDEATRPPSRRKPDLEPKPQR